MNIQLRFLGGLRLGRFLHGGEVQLQLGKNIVEGAAVAHHHASPGVEDQRRGVDEDQLVALVGLHQVGHGELPQGGAVDDEHVGGLHGLYGLGQQLQVIGLLLQDDGRADVVAAHVHGALGDHRGAVGDLEEVHVLVALGAPGTHHRAVELQDVLAAGLLVDAVDVHREDGLELAGRLQLGQGLVGNAGLGLQQGSQDPLPIPPEEDGGGPLEEGQAEHLVGGEPIRFAVVFVHLPVVGEAGVLGEVPAGDEDHIIALIDPLLQDGELDGHDKTSFRPPAAAGVGRGSADNDLGENLADRGVDGQVGVAVHAGLGLVDENQLLALVVVYQTGGGIDHQGGAADDEHVGLADGGNGAGHHVGVQGLLIEDHIGTDDAPAVAVVAVGQAGAVGDHRGGVLLAAAGTVVAQGGAVELIDHLAASGLVEAVDVLGDHGLELAGPLQLSQLQVGGVGLGAVDEHLVPVELVELPGVFYEEAVAQNGFGRIVVLLAVQAVHAAEVGDAALGGYARAAEEDDAFTFVNPFL